MSEDTSTVLDSNASFEGKLVGTNVTVRGRFKGDLHASGILKIVEGSELDAKIKANRVEIGGKFNGEVDADTVHILEKGRASGTFRAKKLSMREGAQLNGELEIGELIRESSPSMRASS